MTTALAIGSAFGSLRVAFTRYSDMLYAAF
jgi:hypothetical protein